MKTWSKSLLWTFQTTSVMYTFQNYLLNNHLHKCTYLKGTMAVFHFISNLFFSNNYFSLNYSLFLFVLFILITLTVETLLSLDTFRKHLFTFFCALGIDFVLLVLKVNENLSFNYRYPSFFIMRWSQSFNIVYIKRVFIYSSFSLWVIVMLNILVIWINWKIILYNVM